jgi:formylmethanofuran dehydrogenase subunit E
MKSAQTEAIRKLGTQGRSFGELWDTFLTSAFFIHGHVCGGMPLGFRAGWAALKALGAERELNMAKVVVVETGTGHAAGCFADGAQMSTGCTFGKGLIERAEYGKWALNLIERSSRKAVRVSVRPDVMQASFNSPFVKMRHEGVPPTEVPLEISTALVDGLLAKPEEDLFVVSDVFEYPLPQSPAATFNLVTCTACGEVVAENKVRLKDGKPLCLPCAGYSS